MELWQMIQDDNARVSALLDELRQSDSEIQALLETVKQDDNEISQLLASLAHDDSLQKLLAEIDTPCKQRDPM